MASEAEEAIATAYRANYALLEYIAIHKFRVPDADVPDLIHEAVVAFIRSRSRIHDERAWLVGAMCNLSRLYWRRQARNSPAAATEHGATTATTCQPDDVARRLDVSAMLRRLPRRCREVLRLRFFEECSSQEIATHLGTTVDYARKMVCGCIAAARRLIVASVRGKL